MKDSSNPFVSNMIIGAKGQLLSLKSQKYFIQNGKPKFAFQEGKDSEKKFADLTRIDNYVQVKHGSHDIVHPPTVQAVDQTQIQRYTGEIALLKKNLAAANEEITRLKSWKQLHTPLATPKQIASLSTKLNSANEQIGILKQQLKKATPNSAKPDDNLTQQIKILTNDLNKANRRLTRKKIKLDRIAAIVSGK